ncbi:MAG: xylulokinase [Planctomycetota bacterium]|nr:xylulokinase [Planctomycetota bacterium]
MADHPVILAVDVGTSGTKVLAVDASGRVLHATQSTHACEHPRPGWAEQDPEQWHQGTLHALKSLLGTGVVAAEEVVAIGLAGQMHGLVALDEAREVVRPAILWNDQRSSPQCDRCTEALGRTFLLEHTGNLMLPGFTVPKLLWMREHEPDRFESIRHVLLPKDYVRFRLGSRLVTDVSDASGTGVFDCGRRDWSTAMLEALELPADWWPRAGESVEVVDHLGAEAARATGLLEGTPLVAGAGDQAASGVGNGITREGLVSATIGTSGVIFASSDDWRYPEDGSLHAFCHAVPETWHLMGVMLSAGGSFDWFCRSLMPDVMERGRSEGRDPFEVVTEGAGGIEPGADGLVFLPYLSGERTPHVDPDARGGFVGLTPRHGRDHLARAVIEGAIFGLGDCLELVTRMGVRPDSVRLSGGAAASPLWRSICADVFGCPTVETTTREGTAYGAAILAGTGVGLWPDVPTACEAVVRETRRVEPSGDRERYRMLHRRFAALYPALRPWWSRPEGLE